ncbi:MAG: D-alanyl-D-alanine carboxypeptidase family protein [Eubacteriaceae bacterium]
MKLNAKLKIVLKIALIPLALAIVFTMIAFQNDVFTKVEKIEVSSTPDTTEFIEGVAPDFQGLVVSATYENKTEKEIPIYKLIIENYDQDFIGSQDITIKYKDKTSTIKVNTREKELLALAILEQPNTTQYIEGMDIDLSGLVIEGNYDNHTSEIVDNKNLTIENYDKNVIGDQKVIISYSEQNESFNINVQPKTLLGINIENKPDTTVYPEGLELDLTGLKVIANYDNNIPETISNEDLKISGYKSKTLGEQTITITYKEFAGNFQVTVNEKKVTGIEVTKKPNKTTYTTGQDLDTSGLKISMVYDNGEKVSIDSKKINITGYDSKSTGKQNIKIAYESYNTSFSVTVNTPQEPVVTVSNPTYLQVLVNKKHALPSNYVPSDLVKVKLPVAYVSSEANKLRRPAADALYNLYTAAKKDGLTIVARSGYRSYATQKSIYNNKVKTNGIEYANKYIAKPGQSEHQTGLAMDVTCAAVNNRLSSSFANTAEGKWIKKNAHKYGFIIRYLSGKQGITGYAYEPWHLRYVGVETATSIYQNGLTMEEYYGVN